jgi:hypothetical protein
VANWPEGSPSFPRRDINMAIRGRGNALNSALHFSGIYVVRSQSFRFTHEGSVLFRCHFSKEGRIVQGENLDVYTLELAVVEGQRLLTEKAPADDLDGFEIWQDATLCYASVKAPVRRSVLVERGSGTAPVASGRL